MSAQTLNVIYDTNYTSIITDGGFVNHNFVKKLWFFDLLFWPLNSKTQTNAPVKQSPANEQPPSQNVGEWESGQWNAVINQDHEIANTNISWNNVEWNSTKKKKSHY